MHRARTRYQTRPGSASNPSEANDKEFFVTTSDRIDTLTAPYLPDDWSEVDARAVDTARGLRTDVHRRPLGRRGRRRREQTAPAWASTGVKNPRYDDTR